MSAVTWNCASARQPAALRYLHMDHWQIQQLTARPASQPPVLIFLVSRACPPTRRSSCTCHFQRQRLWLHDQQNILPSPSELATGLRCSCCPQCPASTGKLQQQPYWQATSGIRVTWYRVNLRLQLSLRSFTRRVWTQAVLAAPAWDISRNSRRLQLIKPAAASRARLLIVA